MEPAVSTIDAAIERQRVLEPLSLNANSTIRTSGRLYSWMCSWTWGKNWLCCENPSFSDGFELNVPT